MPIRDWTRVPAGLFHHFHQHWSIEITSALNRGILPKEVSALVEQRAGAPEHIYAARANRIVVKHHLGRTIAVIEIMSPGNKDSRAALRDFVEKTIDFLRAGIHVFIVDLFPPSPRAPFGIHKAIWDEIVEEDFVFPAGKDRILASYQTGAERTAYVEPVAVGDRLPDMPLFLSQALHVMVPLEPTYLAAWDAAPEELRRAVETGVLPEPEGSI
ncbi:MAG: hypothetical protein K2R98_30530 [Gemmataceae bacterium]|nr:hypothetical protein [Gemmataceae bacterium]